MDDLRELSYGELSALCSNLANACDKQQLFEEKAAFSELSAYFSERTEPIGGKDFSDIQALAQGDLDSVFVKAWDTAEEAADRGAKRSLTWTKKATALLTSLLTRFDMKGDDLIEGTNVWVCEICGFIFVGDTPPDVCPICKVPKIKIHKVA